MPSDDFEIYQTESGYTAVTSPVRRAILAALAKRDHQLPELAAVTGRSKSTLSSVHLKELLAQRLVDEVAHPTDARKKFFRLIATRIGSSNLPVDQLRDAVHHYVTLSPLPGRVTLAAVVQSLAAPEDVDESILAIQARALGRTAGSLLHVADGPSFVRGVATLFESQGLVRTLELDAAALRLVFEPGPEGQKVKPRSRLAVVLAGFAQGVADVSGRSGVRVGVRQRGSLGLELWVKWPSAR